MACRWALQVHDCVDGCWSDDCHHLVSGNTHVLLVAIAPWRCGRGTAYTGRCGIRRYCRKTLATGVTRSVVVAILAVLRRLLQGNLGVSLITGQLVSEMIIQRLPPTLELAFSAGILGSVLGVLGGVGAAVKLPYGLSWVAKINLSLALSVPIYWSGTMALLVVSYALPTGSGAEISRFVLPVLVLAFHMSGAVGQMVSANIRLAMDMDFVRTAHAKGLRPVIILWRHVLRLGLLPTITVIGLQIGFLLGGAVIIESLFVRAGLGRLLLESTLQQDYPVVQGIVVLAAVVYAVFLSTCEALYRLIDPRITR